MLGGFYFGRRGSKDVVIPLIRFDGKLLPCIPMTGSAVETEMPSLLETTTTEALAGSRFFDVIDTKLGSVLANNSECAA